MKRKYIITENSTPMVISELFDETPLTQKEISERSGINYTTISVYKYGKSLPTLRCLLYVLDALGKTLMVVDKDEAPTEVHGWWLKTQIEAGDPFDGNSTYCFDVFQCSECGEHFDVSEAMNYCPNCGAKMEGVDNG